LEENSPRHGGVDLFYQFAILILTVRLNRFPMMGNCPGSSVPGGSGWEVYGLRPSLPPAFLFAYLVETLLCSFPAHFFLSVSGGRQMSVEFIHNQYDIQIVVCLGDYF